jgi:hypothetical protein
MEEKRTCTKQTRRGCRGWNVERKFFFKGKTFTAEQFQQIVTHTDGNNTSIVDDLESYSEQCGHGIFTEHRSSDGCKEIKGRIDQKSGDLAASLPEETDDENNREVASTNNEEVKEEANEEVGGENVTTNDSSNVVTNNTTNTSDTSGVDNTTTTTNNTTTTNTTTNNNSNNTNADVPAVEHKNCDECGGILKTFYNIANAKRISKETPVKYKNGTDTFKMCQRAMDASGTTFKDLAKANRLSSHQDRFVAMTRALTKYYINNTSSDDTIDLGIYKKVTTKNLVELTNKADSEKNKLYDLMARAVSTVRTCVMLVKVTKENFDEKNARYKDTEYLKPELVTSFDQRLKCRSNGLETIDYDECRNMIYAYNASKVVIDGNEALQVFQGQEAANDANMKLMDMKPNEDVSTKALEVQRDGIAKQKEMAEVRAGLQTAKLTAMFTFASSLPKDEDVIELCKHGNDMENIVKYVVANVAGKVDGKPISSLGGPSLQLNDFTESSEVQCLSSYQNDDHGILANTGQKPTAVAIAAEAGIDMAKEMMAVDMLDRQKNMVDGVIDKVKGMDTIDLPEDAFQNPELVTFCQANPNAQECVGFGTGMTTHVNSGGLSFTGGLAANETLNPTTDSDDNATAITTGSADRDGTNALPTSRAIASVDKGGGFEGSTPGKAKVSSSPVGSGGGGAGGGGAPGGGGLSGSGPSTGGKGVAPSSGSKRYKLGYSGGSRPLSFRGGSRRSKKSSSKGIGNPFAKMMKKKGKSTDVFNFRGLASQGIGSKDGDLFKRISNSYNTVNKKNRLIKYKIAE